MLGNKSRSSAIGEHWDNSLLLLKGTTKLDLARIMRATPETALRAPTQTASAIVDKAKEKGTTSLTKGCIGDGPDRVDYYKKGREVLKDPDLWKTPSKKEIADMKQRVGALKRSYKAAKTLGYRGSSTSFARKIAAVHKPAYTFSGFERGIDIRKQIGKLPKPKGGWTLPYNDLENQVRYNSETGVIIEIYDPPTVRTGAITIQHDFDYSVC